MNTKIVLCFSILFLALYAQRTLTNEQDQIVYRTCIEMKKNAFNIGNKGVFYFKDGNLVEEHTTSWRRLKFLYNNPLGKMFRFFFRHGIAARLYGAWQNSRFSKGAIKSFITNYTVDMDDFEIPKGGYASFNDFFVRKLKPGARRVDEHSETVVSPCDGKCFVLFDVTEQSDFLVKDKKLKLEDLFKNKERAQEYEHGTLLIFRLAPYDYHRYHFPIDAIPSEISVISGVYESVNPFVYKIGILPLTENERDIVMLETQQFGTVPMIMVGAMLVGKIHHTYKVKEENKKGDEMGYFAFGGSTILLIFKKDSIKVRDDILDHSRQGYETAVKMGEYVGKKV